MRNVTPLRILSRALILLALVVIGSHGCKADDFIAIGGFVGDTVGASVKAPISDHAWLAVNLGWSTRRDQGVDFSGLVQFPVYYSKQRRKVNTTWYIGAGPRITFFERTEYSLVFTGGAAFDFYTQNYHHELYLDAGPSVAFAPDNTTSLYLVIGYRLWV
jgi:hypothetical protein